MRGHVYSCAACAGVLFLTWTSSLPALADSDGNSGGGAPPLVQIGSLLPISPADSAAEVITVNRPEIDLTSAGNVEKSLTELPEVNVGLSQFTNNGGDGQTTFDLFGLGSLHTLVLA